MGSVAFAAQDESQPSTSKMVEKENYIVRND